VEFTTEAEQVYIVKPFVAVGSRLAASVGAQAERAKGSGHSIIRQQVPVQVMCV